MENLKLDSISINSISDKLKELPSKLARYYKERINILKKSPSFRTHEEISKLVDLLETLDVFKRELLPDPEPKEILRLLTHYLKVETFQNSSALFHLDRPADKMYIILQGMAREFVPKTKHEFNIDYDMLALKGAPNIRAETKETRSSFSTLIDFPNPDAPRIEIVRTSLLNLEPQTNRQRRSSVTFHLQPVVEEPEKEKTGPFIRFPKKALTSSGGKSPRASVSIVPQIEESPSHSNHSSNSSQSPRGKWHTPDVSKTRELDWQSVNWQSSTQREELAPPPRRRGSLIRGKINAGNNTGNTGTLVEMQDEYSQWTAERGVDDDIREEFRRQGPTYYLGRVLKVKYRRMLKPGSACGEGALEGQSTRGTAVIAAGDCICITLHKDDYMKAIRQRIQGHKEKIDFFRQLLDHRDEEDPISTFSLFWEILIFRKRDEVFRQTEPANHVYLVWEGEVTLFKDEDDPQEIKPNHEDNGPKSNRKNRMMELFQSAFKIGIVTTGHIFGEKDFTLGHNFSYTAVVTSPRAKILKLSLKDFKMIRKTYFELVHEMLKKTFSQSNWEKERIKEHNQRHQKDAELTRSEMFNKYLEDRNRVVSLSPSVSNKTPLKGNKRIINLVEKNKRLNLHFEYDKTFVPKPGKVQLGYIESLANKLRTTELQNALYNANSATNSPRQSQQEIQDDEDWLPFTKGKSRNMETPIKEREPENPKPQTPQTTRRLRDSNGLTPTVARRKASGGMYNIDLSGIALKNSHLTSLALAKPLSETKEYPKKGELPILSELKTERKKSIIKIPRLQLEGKIDSPLISPRVSPTVMSARVQLMRNKIGIQFDAGNLVQNNGVFSPISIRSIEHDSHKDSNKDSKDTPPSQRDKDPLVPTKTVSVSCSGSPSNQGHKMSKFSIGLQDSVNKQKNVLKSENFGDLLAKLKQDSEPKDSTATSIGQSPRQSLATLTPRLRKLSLTGMTPKARSKFSQNGRIEYVASRGESPQSLLKNDHKGLTNL